MPFPIIPSYIFDSKSGQGDKNSSGASGFDLSLNMSALEGFLTTEASISKEAAVADGDASLVYSLWKNSKSIKTDDGELEYEIPSGFSNDNLLRLQASGLIERESKRIRFSSNARTIIRNMGLASQNVFASGAVNKPYSVILAEMKRKPKTAGVFAALIGPTKDTEIEKYVRLFSIDPDKNEYKEYTVVMYRSDTKPNRYTVYGYNGRINGTQVPRSQVFDVDYNSASSSFNELLSSKLKKYKVWDQEWEPFNERFTINPDIPGIVTDASVPSKEKAQKPKTKQVNKPEPKPEPTADNTPPVEETVSKISSLLSNWKNWEALDRSEQKNMMSVLFYHKKLSDVTIHQKLMDSVCESIQLAGSCLSNPKKSNAADFLYQACLGIEKAINSSSVVDENRVRSFLLHGFLHGVTSVVLKFNFLSSFVKMIDSGLVFKLNEWEDASPLLKDFVDDMCSKGVDGLKLLGCKVEDDESGIFLSPLPEAFVGCVNFVSEPVKNYVSTIIVTHKKLSEQHNQSYLTKSVMSTEHANQPSKIKFNTPSVDISDPGLAGLDD